MSEPAFFSIVRDRPDPSLSHESITCPYCDSDRISSSVCSTLLGYIGKAYSADDPNHHHFYSQCANCNKRFTYEQSNGNGWYAGEGGILLKGIPSCYENYVYHCRDCNGPVHRTATEPGRPTSWYIFSCKDCGLTEKSERDYWYPRMAQTA